MGIDADTYVYVYDANGNRVSKTKNGQSIARFHMVDGVILEQTVGSDTLSYYYDESGQKLGFRLNDTTDYYYEYNLQGDVIGIFDSSGTKIVTYTYDPWGKLLETGGTAADTIGLMNPIRYRGYYYDTETGFYFLQTRYYDPNTGRFLNADSYTATGVGVIGYNMFSYCNNNPICMHDSNGDRPILSASLRDETKEEREDSFAYMNSINKIYKTGCEVYVTDHLRICTDGAPKGVIPDDYWQSTTAYGNYANDQYLNALTVNYIVLPGDYKGKARLGDRALFIDYSKGTMAYCIVGEVGPKGATFGEVSIAAVWDVGYPEHRTANQGIPGNFTIIVYPDSKIPLDWSQPIQPQIH